MARPRGDRSGAREIAANNPVDTDLVVAARLGAVRSMSAAAPRHALADPTPSELAQLTAQLEQRTARVARSWTGIVVAFDPPAGTRGGPFEVTVSDEGEVVPQRFER
jgi:hypothetical protein